MTFAPAYDVSGDPEVFINETSEFINFYLTVRSFMNCDNGTHVMTDRWAPFMCLMRGRILPT